MDSLGLTSKAGSMRDTLHCVHICWLTQLNQKSHQSMVFPDHITLKSIFYFLFCPLFTFSPPSLFSLAPRIRSVLWREFSKWFSPFFLIGYCRLLILLLFQSFPTFDSAQFPKLCHPVWTISIASIFISLFICPVHRVIVCFLFFCEWFMIESLRRNQQFTSWHKHIDL